MAPKPKKRTNEIVQIKTQTGEHAFVLFDEENDDSLVSIAPRALKEKILAVGADDSLLRLTQLDEHSLFKTLRPEPRLCRLRLNFWLEFENAVVDNRRMRISHICAGIVVMEHFYTIIDDPKKLAFLLNPPATFKHAATETLNLAIAKLREIMELPTVDDKGRPIASVINGILKATEFLDKRVNGDVVRKLAIHQHNTSDGSMGGAVGGLNEDNLLALEEKLAGLRQQLGKRGPQQEIPEPIEAIDVTPEEV